METIIIGGGCFWCLEAVFRGVKGVDNVENGYSGGTTINPDYEAVCTGETGHAEVIKITFNPKEIDLQTILTIFFGIHDPTTLNRQGPDRGTQYRSIILYGDDKQKEIAEHSKLEAQRFWEDPIVTEIVPLKEYFKAEDYHQNYFETHPEMSYCQIIINPKLKHFKETFKQYLKEEYAA